MKIKIIFWAHSYCRSTLKFYAELANILERECVIYTWQGELELRSKVGFKNNEFQNLEIHSLDCDAAKALTLLKMHLHDYNIFGAYQANIIYQDMMHSLHSLGLHYGIMSEAPCNMIPYPLRLVKEVYIRCILPVKLHKVIKYADFIINFSGYYHRYLRKLGWKEEQIISAGYFPPRLPNSSLCLRDEKHWSDFTILLSGIHQWHRSPWLLITALSILKARGITPKCIITQEGPYLHKLKFMVKQYGLTNVEFLGLIPMDKLLRLYESCSVYVGTGNNEPWGMRINDALACGSPLIINRGMGAVKLIDEFGCGLSFARNNAKELADALQLMIENKDAYLRMAQLAKEAAYAIDPTSAAAKYGPLIRKFII